MFRSSLLLFALIHCMHGCLLNPGFTHHLQQRVSSELCNTSRIQPKNYGYREKDGTFTIPAIQASDDVLDCTFLTNQDGAQASFVSSKDVNKIKINMSIEGGLIELTGQNNATFLSYLDSTDERSKEVTHNFSLTDLEKSSNANDTFNLKIDDNDKFASCLKANGLGSLQLIDDLLPMKFDKNEITFRQKPNSILNDEMSATCNFLDYCSGLFDEKMRLPMIKEGQPFTDFESEGKVPCLLKLNSEQISITDVFSQNSVTFYDQLEDGLYSLTWGFESKQVYFQSNATYRDEICRKTVTVPEDMDLRTETEVVCPISKKFNDCLKYRGIDNLKVDKIRLGWQGKRIFQTLNISDIQWNESYSNLSIVLGSHYYRKNITLSCHTNALVSKSRIILDIEMLVQNNENIKLGAGVGGTLGFVLLFLTFGMILTFHRRAKSRAAARIRESEENGQEQSEKSVPLSVLDEVDLNGFSFPKTFVKDLEKLEIKEPLGMGNFGVVKRGYLNLEDGIGRIEVAMKISTSNDAREMLHEARGMIRVAKHEHIVNLLGIIAHDENVYLLMEFCHLGSLQAHLRKYYHDYVKDLQEYRVSQFITWCSQIADGMNYLVQKEVIHGDLASRNILLTHEKVAKVADFGLSSRIYSDLNKIETCKEIKKPASLLAIEVWESQHALLEKSDIWSFGILVWEIFQLGQAIPYVNLEGSEIYHFIKNGRRLAKPILSPRYIYQEIMLNCWRENPVERPSFRQLKDQLDSFESNNQRNSEIRRGIMRHASAPTAEAPNILYLAMDGIIGNDDEEETS